MLEDGQHLDPAVVLAVHDAFPAQHRHDGRHIGLAQGNAQLERRVRLVPQVIQKKHVAALAPDKQRLGGLAGDGPRLDQGEEELPGVGFENHRAHRFWSIFFADKERRRHANVGFRLKEVGVQIGENGFVVAQGG